MAGGGKEKMVLETKKKQREREKERPIEAKWSIFSIIKVDVIWFVLLLRLLWLHP